MDCCTDWTSTERIRDMGTVFAKIAWLLVAVSGAVALGVIASSRGEPINSLWLVAAAICVYALFYRFYSAFIAARVMMLDDRRATPAERMANGHDYEPTNRWIVFGHHFAAIAGPGPLVGPVLAAQFGYLPGTLWIIAGSVLGGAVQDFVILCASLRRDGKSLGEMARAEIGKVGGAVALVTVLLIMIILLAVVALVVVNALAGSPWGTFTIASTMPIALFMGVYLRFLRPGRVLECSLLGFVLVLLAVIGGQWVSQSAWLARWFTWTPMAMTFAMIAYGFLASALPVWLLLAPRDYLSTFVKLGVVFLLALGIFAVHPPLAMPALTRFADGTGPVFAGKIFPFCFITIACGAISGFHALISSGTTPKLIAHETDARPIGYGAMLLESFVAIMAMVAASVMHPGIYFAVNSPPGMVGKTAAAAVTTISGWGFPVTAGEMQALAHSVGELSLFGRTGGAPSLALGMAQIFSFSSGGSAWMAFWYHFAIMFEALFILTIIDAGTRVGRFMLQDALGHLWKPLGRTSWMPGVWGASAAVVAAWGYFLYNGVRDPLGGINSLWPLFGIANQLLAAIALCVATTILLKLRGWRYASITAAPLAWLLTVTLTAAWQKLFSDSPRIGFLAQVHALQASVQAGKIAPSAMTQTQTVIFNARLDAVVCAVLALLVLIVVLDSIRVWTGITVGSADRRIQETPFVPTTLRPGAV